MKKPLGRGEERLFSVKVVSTQARTRSPNYYRLAIFWAIYSSSLRSSSSALLSKRRSLLR